jgi:hypothetical protein
MATARFLQIQAAAERLTRRDAAEDVVKATFEAARDAATRCVECVFVVGIWVAMSAFSAVSAALWPQQPQQIDPEALAQMQAAVAAEMAAAGGGAVPAPEVRVGPSFMGAGMLGLAPAATLRGAAVAAPVPRLGSAAAAAAAEKAERKAAARRPQAPPGVQQGAGPATAAPAQPPQQPPQQPGAVASAFSFVFGKPRAAPERPMSGKERRAAKRAGDAPAAPAAAASEGPAQASS